MKFLSSKYKKQLIIVIIIVIFCSMIFLGGLIQLIMTPQNPEGGLILTPLIPIKNANPGFIFSIIFFIIIITNIIGGVLAGYILGPVFLYVHKKIIGKKMIYGVQERPKTNMFKGTFKGFFPNLMMTSLALWLIEYEDIAKIFVVESVLQSVGGHMYGFIVMLMITSGISMGLFSPVWFLIDSGIVFTNKEKIKLSTEPIEVRSVGRSFQNFLKGYAGISVIFAFYIFMWREAFSVGGLDLFVKILVSIGFLILPIFFSLLSLPAIIILDKTLDKRKNYTLKFAKKLGIVKAMDLKVTLSDLNKLSPRDD